MDKVKYFLSALTELYGEIESWFPQLQFSHEEIELVEEVSGAYHAPQVKISAGQKTICKIVPVGAYIIAADGRADMVGILERRTLVYLSKAYTLSLTTQDAINGHDQIESQKKSLYKGFNGPGWYIVAEGKLSIIKLNKDTFALALEEASEYRYA